MIDSKPIFTKENLAYEREEKEGFWTVIPRLHPETQELIINSTAKNILNLCDGEKTLEEIKAFIKSKYPETEARIIEIDVESTISSYSRLGIVQWKGDNPFLYRKEEPINKDFSMMIGQEEDLSKILKFIKSSTSDNATDLLIYESPTIYHNEYDEIILRSKLFSFSEEFFLIMNKKQICGLVSIEIPTGINNSTSALIKLIICPKEHLNKLIEYAQTNFLILSVKDITKIKLLELSKNPFEKELKKILESSGFKEEGSLKNEFNFEGDVKIYSQLYNQNLIEKINKIKRKQ